MRVCFIGCGEVGLLYATALLASGNTLALCDLKPSPRATEFCKTNEIALHTGIGPWMADSDLVISCVLGTVSLAVAGNAFAFMRKGAIFADMTTCDPQEIRMAAEQAKAAGLEYVDIAIMGAVAMGGVKTPLLCAGEGAETVRDAFAELGAPITAIPGGAAGDAASLKILRSVFTKGLEALAVECFLGAEQQGVTEKLYDAMADVMQTPLRTVLEAFVRTHVIHAPRRLHEVEEAERQLLKAGLPADVLPGVRARFERTCRYIREQPIGGGSPSAEEAFAWLLDNAQKDNAKLIDQAAAK